MKLVDFMKQLTHDGYKHNYLRTMTPSTDTLQKPGFTAASQAPPQIHDLSYALINCRESMNTEPRQLRCPTGYETAASSLSSTLLQK